MRRALPLLVCLLALGLSGCITRSIDEKVFDRDYTRIELRTQKRWGVVEKGYEHPFTISSARMAHILSRIDVRLQNEDGRRVPAIQTETLNLIAEGVAAALAKANPNQQVVVTSIRRGKRLGIFDRKYLTSFIAYRRDDKLYIHLGLVDWEIPPSRQDRLPGVKVGDPSAKYQVVPSRAMSVVDAGSLAVSWRDSIFARPTRVQVLPGGRVVRRTILMEDESAEEAPAPGLPEAPERLPANLSPETLRALADLEEARRRGEITESDYDEQRRRILAGEASE
jgi:hypothetical protein